MNTRLSEFRDQEEAGGGGSAASGQGQAGEGEKRSPGIWLDGGWHDPEEIRNELVAERARRQALEERAQAGVEQRAAASAPAYLPPWAQELKNQGVADERVRALVEDDLQRISEVAQAAARNELVGITKQAQELSGAQSKARGEFKKQHPEFDEGAMLGYLDSDAATKDGYDALVARGKWYQAYAYAWGQKLLAPGAAGAAGGKKVDRGHETPSRARQVVEEKGGAQRNDGSTGGKSIPQDLLDAVQGSPNREDIRRYMALRSKGGPMDLDAEMPDDYEPPGYMQNRR